VRGHAATFATHVTRTGDLEAFVLIGSRDIQTVCRTGDTDWRLLFPGAPGTGKTHGLRERADVFFILTTNRPDTLEPTLASPGRIDQAIESTHLARAYDWI
jgi:hypothetical protein